MVKCSASPTSLVSVVVASVWEIIKRLDAQWHFILSEPAPAACLINTEKEVWLRAAVDEVLRKELQNK